MFGNAHRGRLCLMSGLFQYPPVELFRKMRGLPEFPSNQKGAGDVISHLSKINKLFTNSYFLFFNPFVLISAISLDMPTSNNTVVHCTMLPNPSHLEAVNPVAAGKARARYMSNKAADYGEGGGDDPVIGGDVVCVQVALASFVTLAK